MMMDTNESRINETNSYENSSIEQNPLEQCQAALADWQDKYARLSADLENYRKRVAKEQASLAVHAQASLLVSLLSIVDNFDRAMAHQPAVSAETSSWMHGIAMIHNSFKDLLAKAGVVEVSYEQFNPELHEALMQVEGSGKESGTIITVLEKGYKLGDRVLRPAKVSVAQ